MFEHEFHFNDLVLDPDLFVEAASVVFFLSVHVTCFGKSHMYWRPGRVVITFSGGDFSPAFSVFQSDLWGIITVFSGEECEKVDDFGTASGIGLAGEYQAVCHEAGEWFFCFLHRYSRQIGFYRQSFLPADVVCFTVNGPHAACVDIIIDDGEFFCELA
jgi:hypothetical protein